MDISGSPIDFSMGLLEISRVGNIQGNLDSYENGYAMKQTISECLIQDFPQFIINWIDFQGKHPPNNFQQSFVYPLALFPSTM